MPVSINEYQKCYPTRLKRYFRRNINYRFYDNIIPHVKQQTIGNIPPEIINLFNSDKGEKIKKFQDIIAEMANHIRTTRTQMKAEKITNFDNYYSAEKIRIYEQNITELLNKKLSKLFGNDLNAELKFANNGGFAELFKLSLKNKDGKKIMHDKAFKVFYEIIESLKMNKSMHNNFAEANFWTFIKYNAGHKLDKTQFTKHYISDMKNGYYLTEFIDNDIHPTTSGLNLKMFGIQFIDLQHNKPIGKKDFYDGGGFIKRQNFIDDKVVLRYYKKIINRNTETEQLQVLANQEKIAENPKTPHRDKIKRANELYIQHRKTISQQQKTNKKFSPFKIIFNIYSYFVEKQYKLINYFNNNKI